MLSFILITAALSGLLASVFTAAGMWLYDFHSLRHQRHLHKHPYQKRLRARPLISILVLAGDNKLQLQDCLRRLLSDRYRNKEIIIISSRPERHVERWISIFTAAQQKKLRIVHGQSSSGLAFETAAHHSNGELVLSLHADQLLDSQSLVRIAMAFNSSPTLDAIILKSRLIYRTSGLSAILEVYYRLVLGLVQKRDSALGIATVNASSAQLGIVYHRHSLETGHVKYVSDIALTNAQPLSFGKLLRLYCRYEYRQTFQLASSLVHRSLTGMLWSIIIALVRISAILLPFMLAYFTYMAIAMHQTDLLLLSWLLIGTFVVISIWNDEHMLPRSKLTFTLIAPVMITVSYLASVLFALSSSASLYGIFRSSFRSITKLGRPHRSSRV